MSGSTEAGMGEYHVWRASHKRCLEQPHRGGQEQHRGASSMVQQLCGSSHTAQPRRGLTGPDRAGRPESRGRADAQAHPGLTGPCTRACTCALGRRNRAPGSRAATGPWTRADRHALGPLATCRGGGARQSEQGEERQSGHVGDEQARGVQARVVKGVHARVDKVFLGAVLMLLC